MATLGEIRIKLQQQGRDLFQHRVHVDPIINHLESLRNQIDPIEFANVLMSLSDQIEDLIDEVQARP